MRVCTGHLGVEKDLRQIEQQVNMHHQYVGERLAELRNEPRPEHPAPVPQVRFHDMLHISLAYSEGGQQASKSKHLAHFNPSWSMVAPSKSNS